MALNFPCHVAHEGCDSYLGVTNGVSWELVIVADCARSILSGQESGEEYK